MNNDNNEIQQSDFYDQPTFITNHIGGYEKDILENKQQYYEDQQNLILEGTSTSSNFPWPHSPFSPTPHEYKVPLSSKANEWKSPQSI